MSGFRECPSQDIGIGAALIYALIVRVGRSGSTGPARVLGQLFRQQGALLHNSERDADGLIDCCIFLSDQSFRRIGMTDLTPESERRPFHPTATHVGKFP
jgi:hypothetical protein